jgi:phosphoglycerol transferase MdoB-like AlkP superfamily enzyme
MEKKMVQNKENNFKKMCIKIKRTFVSFVQSLIRYSKTNVLFFTFVITSLINGSILRIITVKNIFDISPVLADLSVILLIGAFGYLLKPKHQFKYFMAFSIIFTLVCVINSVYYNNYLSFVSFSLLKSSTQLVGVTDAVFQNVMELKDFIYLFQIVAMFFVHRYLKKKHYYEEVNKIEVGKERLLNTMVAGLITLGFFVSTLTSTDIGRLNKQWNRNLIMMKFGTYTYQLNDLFATLKSKINPLFGYDEAAKTFREYYSVETEHETNEYTDIFKGKNVIVIHAESIQNFLLDTSFNGEYVTPNLRKLASEGLYFSNFYAQESVGTSSDSEFTYSTSLLPASSGTVFVNYFDREYTSIQKLLKEEGYYVFSMHGNNCAFWNRSAMHKSLGYDNFYCYKNAYTIDEKIGLGLSDKSFFRQSSSIIEQIKQEHNKFYGTMIMLSNHTPFNDDGTAYSDFDVTYKYTEVNEETGLEEEKVAPYMEGTKLGYYFKSAHYADEALGEFIDELDEKGLLDDTVLVIYGDHDAKLKKSEYVRFYNYDPTTDSILDSSDPNYIDVDYYQYELNRSVPFIIWTKDHKYQKEIDTVMGMIDVLPTLGNMLGIESKYALGTDIFSLKDDEENVVVFPDGNWLTNKMYYSRSKEEGKLLDESDTVSAEYINNYNAYAEKIISISDSIIVHDLIKKVGEEETEGTEE